MFEIKLDDDDFFYFFLELAPRVAATLDVR